MMTLPAYSSELNPVEVLWDQLKGALCNRMHEILAHLEIEFERWLRGFWSDGRRVRSLVFG